jgi:hypothetical protein
MVGRREPGWQGRQHTWEYVRGIGQPGDALRVRLTTERGVVVDFTVQYEAWIDGVHRPVVRYDTAHGTAHRDLLGPEGDVIAKRWMPGPFDKAFNDALDEIQQEWPEFREAFVRRQP